MVSKGDKVWVIYPEYLDINLSRKKGRKVPRTYALRHPKREEMVRAAKELDIFLYEEKASHPGNWWRKKGRVVVRKEIPKLMTLKALSKLIMEERRKKKKK
ncbi:MAG TPA: signal recognition particle protein Srp19 [Thermoplasmata archaeon]|nr:signal recognition particle protein Srp19 [Thermoplasmata archaeon]